MRTINEVIETHKKIQETYKLSKKKVLENAYHFLIENLVGRPDKMSYCWFFGEFDIANGEEREVEKIQLEYNELFDGYDVFVTFADDSNTIWEEELYNLSENDILEILDGIKRNNTFAK